MNAIQSIYGKSAVKENYLDKVGIVICKNYFDGFIDKRWKRTGAEQSPAVAEGLQPQGQKESLRCLRFKGW